MATMVLSADYVRYWIPRILGLFAVGLLMLLASDAHEAALPGQDQTRALLVHLVPAAVVLLMLIAAWRWELFGAVTFVLLGALYVVATRGRFSLGTYLLISGTLILTGVLFLVDWNHNQREASRP